MLARALSSLPTAVFTTIEPVYRVLAVLERTADRLDMIRSGLVVFSSV
jgi:hypothetical protein